MRGWVGRVEQRTRHPRRLGVVAVAVVLGSASLVACGDSSDDGASPDPGAASDVAGAGDTDDSGDGDAPVGDAQDAVEVARDIAQQAVDDTSGDARATVVIDGVTYEFRAIQPGADDDFYSFCSTVAGSLQATMQLVDDAGARVDNAEIDFVLLEPGGPYEQTGDPAELQISLPELGPAGFTEVEINAPVSGRSASGTFVVDDHLGNTLSGTIDASC